MKWIKENYKPDMTKVPLHFTANEDGSSVSLGCYDITANDWEGGLVDSWCKLDYSMDGKTWNTYIDPDSSDETLRRGKVINLNKGETVYFRATLGDVPENPNLNGFSRNDGWIYHYFVMEGSIKADGNIQFLLENSGTKMDVPQYSYFNMFNGCTSLTQAPELPATTLAEKCYAYMFSDCSNIPEPKYKMPNMTFDEVANAIQNDWILGETGTYEVQCSDKILVATFDISNQEWTITEK